MAAVWAIVVAGGAGLRFGGAKQYALLGGRSVLSWAVDAARTACDGVVVVVPADDLHAPEVLAVGADAVVPGGASRSASVRAGMAAVPSAVEIIVVHDAARPLAASALFSSVIDAVRAGADGAICAVPINDTIKRVSEGQVTETLDRAELVAVQTPQAFAAGCLRAAHAGAPETTDDAAVVESAGGRVMVVPGDARNIKLTDPIDLVLAAALAST